jgi:hypothetical protein
VHLAGAQPVTEIIESMAIASSQRQLGQPPVDDYPRLAVAVRPLRVSATLSSPARVGVLARGPQLRDFTFEFVETFVAWVAPARRRKALRLAHVVSADAVTASAHPSHHAFHHEDHHQRAG